MAEKSNIHLYTAQTPNGIKVSIVLEELGLKYETTNIEFSKNTQKEPWFLEINPNGRIPALTDVFEDGKPIRLFESAAIMQYLVDRYDKDHKISYPYGSREYWEVNNWVFWQMGGLGPMQGQLNHFNRYAPEKLPYAIDRYKNETRRLYRTMDTALQSSKSGYLVGDKCTLADISSWGWVAVAAGSGVDINEFPALKKWRDLLLTRPGLEKGRHVPSPHKALEQENLTEEQIAEAAKKNAGWIQAGMKADKK
ncbi:glutathione S-transferase [Pestalotiopsis sp. NC0098]|nr:glutathione S-transferase [Pestalotiopsis sp. NC0098]